MEETKVYRLDYRSLNRVCTYCTKPSTVIKVITTTTGDVMVGTLCEAHAKGEQGHFIANEGMVMAGDSVMAGTANSSTLIDPDAMRGMAKNIAEGGVKALVDAADELEGKG